MSLTRRTEPHGQKAAVVRLPNELLLEIFALGLNAQQHFSESRWERQAVRLLKCVTAVCSAWRDAAIFYYLLWRRVTLARPKGKDGYDSISHRLRTFLARSKNVTLDIHIDLHKPSSKRTQRLGNILFRHIQRCRTLSLVSHGDWMDALGPSFELSGPLVYLTDLSTEGAMAKPLPASPFLVRATWPPCHVLISSSAMPRGLKSQTASQIFEPLIYDGFQSSASRSTGFWISWELFLGVQTRKTCISR